MNEEAYTARVSYRLKKWMGLEVHPPPFNGGVHSRGPHEARLCEGCKAGKCENTEWERVQVGKGERRGGFTRGSELEMLGMSFGRMSLVQGGK